MKKYIFSLLMIPLFFLTTFGQDIKDVRKGFEEMMKNKSGVPYGNNAATGKYYDLRGFKMYCEVYGEGELLLMIHGNGGSVNNFVNNIPYFSKKYKVIIADSRSQGKSVDTGDSLTYEMMADDYAALLSAMRIDSADVIGWSDGGINGLLLALRHPGKVKKLVITGANLQPDTTAVFPEIWDMVKPEYEALKNKTDKAPREKSAWKLVRLLWEQPHIPVASLHNIKCPTLVIGGDHDVIREGHTLLIAQNIPRSYLWILPNSGHSTPVRYKNEFNTTVDEFFSNPYRVIRGEARFY